MTKISLITQGQQLICANKVVIASGDINSVELKVEFDSAWDEYPVKVATFHTSSNPTVHEMLMMNNSCIVPFEVLTESCVLFIGVRGVSADGEKLKTSTLAKYKISEGATAGDKTLSPTMDLYQQYLAALKAEADPIITALKEELQASIQSSVQEVTDTANQILSSSLDSAVLWETDDIRNDYPGTGGGAGKYTITFDATEYKTFRIRWGDLETTVSMKGKETKLVDSSYNSFGVTITDTGMTMRHLTPYDNVHAMVIGYKF